MRLTVAGFRVATGARRVMVLGGRTASVGGVVVGGCSDRRSAGADFVYFLLGGVGEFYHDCTGVRYVVC